MVNVRRVSVIVPTSNRPVLLRDALASIRALEGPDLTFEILVGDNGANPQTPVVVNEMGGRYFKVDMPGAAPARNAGLSAATGDYVAFLDDDDIWLPENIRPHLAQLEARPEIDAVIGQVIYTDKDLNPIGTPVPAVSPGEGDAMLREMLGEWFPQVGTCVARIGVRETVGQFPDKHIHGEDVEWFLKLAQTRKVAFQNTPCILFRGRPSGSFDDLNRSRTKAGRRIFLRYALAEWRIWRSIPEFLRGYRAKLIHFYQYFFDAARDRRQAGNLRAAIVALLDAAYVFPFQLMATVLTPGPVKRAIKARAQHNRA